MAEWPPLRDERMNTYSYSTTSGTFSVAQQPSPSPKKVKILFIIIIILFIISIILLLSYLIYTYYGTKPYYNYLPYDAHDPNTWIAQSVKDTGRVDVPLATDYYSQFTMEGQRYFIPEKDTTEVFALQGIYLGYSFPYLAIVDGNEVLRIGPEFIPDDNVPEAFAFERWEDGKLKVYIFFDEDWKRVHEDRTYIIYGKSYNMSKKFVFNQAREGIYYDVVEDDMGRFVGGIGGSERFGGVIAGTFDERLLGETPPEQLIAVMIT